MLDVTQRDIIKLDVFSCCFCVNSKSCVGV